MDFKKLVLRLEEDIEVEANMLLPHLSTLEFEGEVKITTLPNPSWTFIKGSSVLKET